MHKHSLKLIFNPNAGPGDGNPSARLDDIVDRLTGLGFRVDVTLSPRKKARAAARKALKQGYKTIAVMGGDGTIEAVAAALVGTKTRLAILPNGTYNNLAKSLGVPENLDDACALLKESPVQKIDVGRVKGRKGKMYFFEQVGLGLTAAIFPEIGDVDDVNLQNLTAAVKTFLGYKAPHVTLTLDGENTLEVDTLLVALSNAPAFGPTFLQAPGASMDDGLLEISLYPGFSKAELLAYFAAIMDGGVSSDDRVQRYRARKVVIKTDPPQEAVADNILLGEGSKFKARILRRALRVIAPPTGGLAHDTPPKKEQLPAPAD